MKFPEYEPGALFKCTKHCGTFRRDACHTVRGWLCCPVCQYRSLQFVK
ncbi:hypothetical protein HYPP_03821 [Hyphomicrobium sp. ghe19]|nr:hypothetical protein HYPP_03821 [Hyphomicrobium sp. ghe19]